MDSGRQPEPRNCKLSEEMKTLGFKQCHSDPCLFIRGEGKDKVYALFHVDDANVVGISLLLPIRV